MRKFLLQRAFSVNNAEPPQAGCSQRNVAMVLTKDALWLVFLLSSLTLWAAVWAGAASVASAWLQ